MTRYANGSTVSGDDRVCVGNNLTVTGDRCLAFGNNCKVRGVGCTVVGNNNTIQGVNVTAYGNHNNVQGVGGNAYGNHCRYSGMGGNIVGRHGNATGVGCNVRDRPAPKPPAALMARRDAPASTSTSSSSASTSGSGSQVIVNSVIDGDVTYRSGRTTAHGDDDAITVHHDAQLPGGRRAGSTRDALAGNPELISNDLVEANDGSYLLTNPYDTLLAVTRGSGDDVIVAAPNGGRFHVIPHSIGVTSGPNDIVYRRIGDRVEIDVSESNGCTTIGLITNAPGSSASVAGIRMGTTGRGGAYTNVSGTTFSGPVSISASSSQRTGQSSSVIMRSAGPIRRRPRHTVPVDPVPGRAMPPAAPDVPTYPKARPGKPVADDDETTPACSVCMANECDATFVPCGHECVCVPCALILKANHAAAGKYECVLCKTTYTSVITVFKQ